MRACEGCRRRKIKCDAATTNSWPCAACTRLKLNCVPPTVNYEKESDTPGVHTFELQSANDYPTIPVGNISNYQRPPSNPQQQYTSGPLSMHAPVQPHYAEAISLYQQPTYITPTSGQDSIQYGAIPSTSLPPQDLKYHEVFTTPPSVARPGMDAGWKSEGSVLGSVVSTADALSDHMGALKIDHVAIGMCRSRRYSIGV